MEYSLRLFDSLRKYACKWVLILILMEYSLRLKQLTMETKLKLSLNPYSNGI